MLSLWATVDLGVIATKEYSIFPKAPALLEPHYKDTCWRGGGSYSYEEMQSVYSTAQADWAGINQGLTSRSIYTVKNSTFGLKKSVMLLELLLNYPGLSAHEPPIYHRR